LNPITLTGASDLQEVIARAQAVIDPKGTD
jgi:hypothetical protein